MSYTPFNAPLLSGLLGDAETTAAFSVKAEIAAMLRFEVALAEAEAGCGLIPAQAASAIAAAADGFEPDMPGLGAATARDGVSVPELVRQLRAMIGEPHGEWLHFGATSQDVIDTSLVMRLAPVLNRFVNRLDRIDNALAQLIDLHGKKPLLARTRMQAAIPVTWSDRLGAWRAPLQGHAADLDALRARVLAVQLGGAAGTLDRLGDRGPAVRAALAAGLGLADPGRCWHTDRTRLVALTDWMARLTGSLGKTGMDIALMAQNGIDAVIVEGGGRSSAMAHKQNPIAAETLVTLARFNATLSSGMQQAMVHEQERSGAAWTLEWMLLPQMTVATGAALARAESLLGAIRPA